MPQRPSSRRVRAVPVTLVMTPPNAAISRSIERRLNLWRVVYWAFTQTLGETRSKDAKFGGQPKAPHSTNRKSCSSTATNVDHQLEPDVAACGAQIPQNKCEGR